jgi:hypothetical protein
MQAGLRHFPDGPLGVGLEGAGLVGEHDRLHAVAELELLEDVRDVRLQVVSLM